MAASKPELLPVYLNVYNVSNYESVKVLNAVFAHLWAPVKFGGVFHVGVQIGDIEWSYGKTLTASRPGVIGLPPLSDTKHSFRESIFMGHTEKSLEAINAIVRDLVEDFPGYQYDVFRKNCNHFADSLCHRLQVSRMPEHINRFARIGACAENFVKDNFGDFKHSSWAHMVPSSPASYVGGSEKAPACEKYGHGRYMVPKKLVKKAFRVPGAVLVTANMEVAPL
ncbi:unnamed protein product [Symbiodinium natans]|uniref:PPPDE domain-containing protein n=1 Tax=Symbiodinium natans TaxID=878477 RepID=A0A812JTV3_9DINO|nr:unnamed protein product [Symbiodinium natans]